MYCKRGNNAQELNKMVYEVERNSFTGKGKIRTDLKFKTFEEAQEFTNMSKTYYPNCEAEVIEI